MLDASRAGATMQTGLTDFSLFDAIAGRRARRFGLGMEIPSGPLAHRSEAEPLGLSERERSILVAAGTGVTGWSFGVPFGPDRPDEHAHYTQRFTGRTAPTAAGIGTPVLFATDDSGTYLTNTRDLLPDHAGGGTGSRDDAQDAMVELVRAHTVQLSGRRLDLPAAPPHMLEPNLWMANAPGSTVFLPVADASQQVLGFMAMALANGNVLVDDVAGRPAGDPAPFVRSGLLDEGKRIPLTVLQQMAYEANVAELAFMGHNIVLTLQAMGLGGLYFNGLNRWSVLGAFQDQGIDGLGFRFVRDPRWTLPNPVGLDGHFEGLCPPYVSDMREAVDIFVERKFGPGGAYDPGTPGAWADAEAVKRGVTPYSEEFVDCLAGVAQYVHDTYGRFPNTFTTMVLTGYVQAVHLDTGFYDAHYRPGAYLPTHAHHMERWHGDGAGD
ncbi:hypothetical protein ACH9EU_14695 [Kocuria sp. M1R5S2]|uniref:hypothetical protein n=1 Tax=Kocuria rhizosphaerae TaxID=3376285 RepID=UPI00378C41FC